MVIDYESAAIEQQSIEILEVIVVVIVVAVVRSSCRGKKADSGRSSLHVHNFVSSFCYASSSSSSSLPLPPPPPPLQPRASLLVSCCIPAIPLPLSFLPGWSFLVGDFPLSFRLRRLPTLARRGARQVPSLPRPPLPALRPASSCPIQTCLRLLRLRNRFLVLTFRPLRPIMLQMRRCSPPGLQLLLHRVLLQSLCNPRQLRCLSSLQQLQSPRIRH